MWVLGDAIKELREDKNLSQKQLAEKLDITPRSMSFYESSERKVPIDMLPKIADVLETTVEYLVTGEHIVNIKDNKLKIKFKSGKANSINIDKVQNLIKLLEENKIDAEALIEELNSRSDK